jgi:N-acetylmuramoyl-L-alanine amidase
VLNDVSIGIEIVNPGHEWGYRPFPAAQMEAVRELCLDILSRHTIPPRNVVGHSDIAPNRKQDPGELFPWAWLAEAGIGFWPGGGVQFETAPPDLARAAEALDRIGYPMEFPLDILLTAFQRHYVPDRVNGLLDERTMAMLLNVDPPVSPEI